MLISQLGLVALFAFEPLISARSLSRRLPERNARAIGGLVENVVRRDNNDEVALADLFTDASNNNLEDDSRDIQGYSETISENVPPAFFPNNPTDEYSGNGAEANPSTSFVGIDADSSAIADGSLPDDQYVLMASYRVASTE